jgi:hypothetical protein
VSTTTMYNQVQPTMQNNRLALIIGFSTLIFVVTMMSRIPCYRTSAQIVPATFHPSLNATLQPSVQNVYTPQCHGLYQQKLQQYEVRKQARLNAAQAWTSSDPRLAYDVFEPEW